MKVLFLPDAFEQYVYWQDQGRANLSKLNRLIREYQRYPFDGTGKP